MIRRGVLLAVLVAACGGTDGRSSAAARSDAGDAASGAAEYRPPRNLAQVDLCALLPASAIPAGYGQVLEGPRLTRDPAGKPTCWYVLSPNQQLVVELLDAGWYDMQRGVWDPKRVEDVSGVGEKAFWVKLRPPSDPYLVAVAGSVAVKVATRDEKLARDVARVVLGKL